MTSVAENTEMNGLNTGMNCNAQEFEPMLMKQDYEETDGETEQEGQDEAFTYLGEVPLDPNSSEVQYYNPCIEKPIPGRYCPPLNREFTGIYVGGIPDEKMRQIIGAEGKVFKAISHQTGVDYLFYLKEENLIAVWGYADSLPYAVERLHARIQLVLNDFKV